LQAPAEEAATALTEGALGRLAAVSSGADGDTVALHLAVCPTCGQEASLEVRLEKVTRDKKDNEQTEDLAHVSYPGRALPALEALCPPDTDDGTRAGPDATDSRGSDLPITPDKLL
jgi:hypothetical protein